MVADYIYGYVDGQLETITSTIDNCAVKYTDNGWEYYNSAQTTGTPVYSKGFETNENGNEISVEILGGMRYTENEGAVDSDSTVGTITNHPLIFYDNLGNIENKKVYDFTADSIDDATHELTIDYNYETLTGTNDLTSWKKALVSVDLNGSGVITSDEKISYDRIGNPTTYLGATLTWFGRQLTSYTKDDTSVSYKYNVDGLRTEKIVDGVKREYVYIGDQLHYEKRGSKNIFYFYDSNGYLTGLKYDGTTYYPATTLNGDVVAIYDHNGTCLVEYEYDAWGNCTIKKDLTDFNLAKVNPIRYRGYYYDRETGFYLTGTRYYDPEIGRFINADSVISGTGESVQGYNLFAYCFNNPVNMSDPSGNWPKWATKLVAAVAVVAVVAAVAAVTVATAGAGTAIAAVAVGAAKGAAIGFAVGAASGAAIGYATTGTLEGTLNGMADGALSGSISGAITGGVNGYSNYSSAANFLKSNGANPKEVLSSYKGTPKVQTLKTDTTVYRTWGGTTQELGHWVSPNNYGSSARNLLSLPTGNTMTNTSSFLLPKGTTVLAGKAAPLFGQSGGGVQWWISVLG